MWRAIHLRAIAHEHQLYALPMLRIRLERPAVFEPNMLKVLHNFKVGVGWNRC